MKKSILLHLLFYAFASQIFGIEMKPVNFINVKDFYQFTGQLKIQKKNNIISKCTITFLSSNVGISAKHCFEDTEIESLPNIKSYIIRGQISPGKFEDVSVITGYQFVNAKKDMALVSFYPPLETDGIEFPKLIIKDQKSLNRKKVKLGGYPGSKNGALYSGEGYVYNFRGDHSSIFRHDINTEKGVSGAAVREYENDFNIVGIHTHGNAWGKHGVLFSKKDMEFIDNYIANENVAPLKNLDYLKILPNYIKGQESIDSNSENYQFRGK